MRKLASAPQQAKKLELKPILEFEGQIQGAIFAWFQIARLTHQTRLRCLGDFEPDRFGLNRLRCRAADVPGLPDGGNQPAQGERPAFCRIAFPERATASERRRPL